jgi:hypothetical protein
MFILYEYVSFLNGVAGGSVFLFDLLYCLLRMLYFVIARGLYFAGVMM